MNDKFDELSRETRINLMCYCLSIFFSKKEAILKLIF